MIVSDLEAMELHAARLSQQTGMSYDSWLRALRVLGDDAGALTQITRDLATRMNISPAQVAHDLIEMKQKGLFTDVD